MTLIEQHCIINLFSFQLFFVMQMDVLIVDDDDIMLSLHHDIVKKCGLSATPVCCKFGEQALQHIQSKDPDQKFLVLLDINMPVMNGWEFMDALNDHNHNNVCVVIVTSSVNRDDRDKARTYKQVIDYFEKPISYQTLLGLRQLLSG